LIYANWIATTVTIVMAEPIVRLIFEGGEFGHDSTVRAALALKCLMPGLVAFSLVNILARAFFALGDVKTPMRIAVFSLSCNLLFALFLIPAYKQAGMGIANTLSSLVNLGLLWYAIRRKFPNMKVQEMKIPTLTVLGSGTLAAFITWATWKYIVSLVETPKLWTQLVEVFVPLIIGTSLYGLITYWAGVPAAKDIAKLLQQKLDKE
jgi:putative peptidoglycan lipid II flippase